MSRFIWNANKRHQNILGLAALCLVATLPSLGFAQGAGYPPGTLGSVYSGPQMGYGPGSPYGNSNVSADASSRGVELFGDEGIFTNSEPHFLSPKAETPLERFLVGMTRNSFVRIEYLNWRSEGPGKTLLGTNTTETVNPRLPFPTATGTARVLDLADISFRDTNGVRGVFGIPLMGATLEINAFLLAQASDGLNPSGTAPSPGNFIATTVYSDGAIGPAMRIYDQFFKATYTTDFWGGGAQLVYDNGGMGQGLRLLPIFGFQYLNLSEQLTQLGSFNNGGLSPAFSTLIDSDTINNVYGPRIGFRTEYVNKWMTIGIDNILTPGINNYRARLITERVIDGAEPRMVSEIESTVFSPVWEFALYSKLHINDNFSLFVSYNFIWMQKVLRPDETIDYNVNTVLGTPVSNAFSVRDNFQQMRVEGLTVGGEIRFR